MVAIGAVDAATCADYKAAAESASQASSSPKLVSVVGGVEATSGRQGGNLKHLAGQALTAKWLRDISVSSPAGGLSRFGWRIRRRRHRRR